MYLCFSGKKIVAFTTRTGKIHTFEPTCNVIVMYTIKTTEMNRKHESCVNSSSSGAGIYKEYVWPLAI